jgi:hypothetical protein
MCVCYDAMQHLQASLWSHPTNWHGKLKRCVGKANFCPWPALFIRDKRWTAIFG